MLSITSVLVLLMACSPDAPSTAPKSPSALRKTAQTDPAALIAQAVAGAHVRGEQDDMLSREAVLPGFGGFYIDSLDQMVVYMKAGSPVPDSQVRRVLVNAYSRRAEQRIQQLLPAIGNARIARGDYSLSELISFENRISHSTSPIPGLTGTGTSLIMNRVVIGFSDSARIEAGLSAVASLGVPQKAVIAQVWGRPTMLSSFDQADPVRPTRGGLKINIHNSTQYPWVYVGNATYVTQESLCSLGFNVRWYNGAGGVTDYMMSAAHCANGYRGINGVLGDTVFQPRPAMGSSPPMANAAGFVDVNEPWGTACDPNPYDGSHTDFCTGADVMLIRIAPGVTTDRRLATSQYQGLNGSPGTMKINNYYPISSVVTPEWVSAQRYGVAKSGATTGTTSGTLLIPATQLWIRLCWTFSNCPSGGTGGVQIELTNVVTVAAGGWGWATAAASYSRETAARTTR